MLIIFLALAFCFCHNPASRLKPAGEKILTKPLDEFTPEDFKKLRVLVRTNYGDFVIGFYPKRATLLVKNFVKLVREGFYDGLNFFMLIPHYMVVGGDPKGDGTGGPGYWLPVQYNDLPKVRGAVGMFHPPLRPSQIGSQFYVLLDKETTKTSAYPVFGYVEKGIEVLDRISELPTEGPKSKPYPWKARVPVIIRDMTLMVVEEKK